MNRDPRIFCLLVLALAVWTGCAGNPPAKESKTGGVALDRIQGKSQVLMESTGATDAALNAGGPSVYLWEGSHRYRLFFKAATEIVHGKEYVAEGIDAQKAIDNIGDPDQGRNGYPLPSSCERVVRMAWSGLPFDVIDGDASLLRARVKRYPARHVFLVTRIRLATPQESAASAEANKDAAAEEENVPEVTVAADQQRALLIDGPKVLTAPLWAPEGGTVSCKVVISTQGKIAELATGAQLCETVPWSQFRYQPSLQRGHPVRVGTEVEVCFEPRK